MMRMRFTFILLLTFKWRVLTINYDPSDDAHGLKVSLNDDFIVAAFNSWNFYTLCFLSKRINFTGESNIFYLKPELYVYSLSTLTMKSTTNTVSFMQIAENVTSNDVVLSLVTFTITIWPTNITLTMLDTTVWKNGHQEYMLLKVDPQEKYAYIFADSFILSYDLSTNKVDQFILTNGTFYGTDQERVIPNAFDLTNKWAYMVGFCQSRYNSHSRSRYYIVKLRPLSLTCHGNLGYRLVHTSNIIVYNRDYGMSVSINPSGTLIAIGEARSNTVRVHQTCQSKTSSSIDYVKKELSVSTSGMGFGRSVAWLDDRGTLAVLVDKSKTHVWSKSEIHVYKNISTHSHVRDGQPDFILPNNQQPLTINDDAPDFILNSQQTLAVNSDASERSFLLILARSNSLLILLDNSKILYIPSVAAGLRPVVRSPLRCRWVCVLQPRPCVSGSYKNTSGPGPCTICPPQTKSPLDNSLIQCQPCNPTSFCPMGASDDVNLNNFRSYTQTFNYPNSPTIDNYDDLLVLNFLSLGKTVRCIVVSPLFWALLALGLCFIVWFIMFLLKIRQPTSVNIHRKRAKHFFKHADVIGEGERWIGGLASFAIFVLIGFVGWFASDYLRSYPIEEASTILISCRDERNTKFDNALQLPLPETDGTFWKIFDMLNNQPFTMSVDLINTRAQCPNIRVQHNRHTTIPLPINKENCTLSGNNVTGSFCFAVPSRTSTVQIDIIGPYFIGALRLCLHGPGSVQDEVNRLHELNACTLFYVHNQTIGLETDFSVRLIKVINVTKPLKANDKTLYDGRWAPTIKNIDILSDEFYFATYGQYLRYVSDRTTFTVQFYEETYFVQNNQSPIVRLAALVFHTLLFISLLIEIFGTVFLLYKLCCHPLFRHLPRSVLFSSNTNSNRVTQGTPST